MTLEQYLYEKGLSHSTVKTYCKSVLEFTQWLKAEDTEAKHAGRTDVMAYLGYLQKKGLANVTRSIQLNVLKHFFDYQNQEGCRTDNPASHLKIRGSGGKKLYPTLSRQELQHIYQGYIVPPADDPRANRNWFIKYRLSRQRNKAILGLMVWQGLTTPEINNLLLNEVKLREGQLFVAGGRKSAERTLELKPQQIMELMEYQFTTRQSLLEYREGKGCDRFFVSVPPSGKSTSDGKDVTNAWKRLGGEVEKICPRFQNFRQIRASVITHWLAQHNLRQVQYMAGHRYVSSTETYLVNQMEDLQADIARFHPIG